MNQQAEQIDVVGAGVLPQGPLGVTFRVEQCSVLRMGTRRSGSIRSQK
jgi:hypothetical protein